MARHIPSPSTARTVLLFGPQALSFDATSFDKLRSSVLSSDSHHWVLDIIKELPGLWDTLAAQFPKLQSIAGSQWLADLAGWFETGAMAQRERAPLPNTVLSPLVVITQLTEYSEYLRLAGSKHQDSQAPHHERGVSRSDTETIGFCTGILSAIAVSCSEDQSQFAQFGGVAVRLALLIGALVDAQDASDSEGPSRSLATVWKSRQSKAELMRILGQFPEVSNIYLSGRTSNI